ncbi:hypothetical protein I7I53_04833 [Histoplasma capsulatum var. duboisii H88]|uniref:Uncharacterized protein n=1 Tax=Ajellomyces capsulatus (strain H88) TaxID=544711 RepID=A0A8A1LQN4_AJEC8|nr:hypothetical protein I7I53_04833 [Histoplasma capsulatum var. duboisii H88]
MVISIDIKTARRETHIIYNQFPGNEGQCPPKEPQVRQDQGIKTISREKRGKQRPSPLLSCRILLL